MIAFGLCVGSAEKFESIALPGIRAHGEPDAPVVTVRDAHSIFPAYNYILDSLAPDPSVEAVVLLHDDVEIRDPQLCPKIRSVLSDPGLGRDVAVIGVVGARQVDNVTWWEGEGFGRCQETRGVLDFGGGRHVVDAVDGHCMVFSRWAVENLRFDSQTYSGFHAYDVDVCFAARFAGKLVVVEELDVFHHTSGGYKDTTDYLEVNELFCTKWARLLSGAGIDASIVTRPSVPPGAFDPPAGSG